MSASLRQDDVIASPQTLKPALVQPSDVWQALADSQQTQLVDVRTSAEWAFSGLPNLSSLNKRPLTLSWRHYPDMAVNPAFIEELQAAIPDRATPLYFLCKTGIRSADAASAAMQAGYTHCYNISHGFEGDRNASGQRGQVNGWKASGLMWEQA